MAPWYIWLVYFAWHTWQSAYVSYVETLFYGCNSKFAFSLNKDLLNSFKKSHPIQIASYKKSCLLQKVHLTKVASYKSCVLQKLRPKKLLPINFIVAPMNGECAMANILRKRMFLFEWHTRLSGDHTEPEKQYLLVLPKVVSAVPCRTPWATYYYAPVLLSHSTASLSLAWHALKALPM